VVLQSTPHGGYASGNLPGWFRYRPSRSRPDTAVPLTPPNSGPRGPRGKGRRTRRGAAARTCFTAQPAGCEDTLDDPRAQDLPRTATLEGATDQRGKITKAASAR
jgi:hypothetical protein